MGHELSIYLLGVATCWAVTAMYFLFDLMADERRQRKASTARLAAETLQEVREARKALAAAVRALEAPSGGEQTESPSA